MRYFAPIALALITLLAPLQAEVHQYKAPLQVEIYTIPSCPGCISAKSLLEEKGIPYHEINLKGNPRGYAEMKARAGGRQEDSMSVPRIFINGKHIGGYMALRDVDFDTLMGKEKVDS